MGNAGLGVLPFVCGCVLCSFIPKYPVGFKCWRYVVCVCMCMHSVPVLGVTCAVSPHNELHCADSVHDISMYLAGHFGCDLRSTHHCGALTYRHGFCMLLSEKERRRESAR